MFEYFCKTKEIKSARSELSFWAVTRYHFVQHQYDSPPEKVTNAGCETMPAKNHEHHDWIYCVTQLMLYTGEKLSSPIFCCL